MGYSKLQIKLNEIPIDGDQWLFDETTPDRLKDFLTPELDVSKYNISVDIRPMGNIYEASVSYKVSHDLLCSKCAYEFKLPVEKSTKEILMVQAKNERIDKQKSTSKNWQDDLFCTELESPNLNLGEFIREVILIDAPNRPLGFGEACETESCDPIKSHKMSSENMENWQDGQKNQPFSILKELMGNKNKSKH